MMPGNDSPPAPTDDHHVRRQPCLAGVDLNQER
jgi:hypothetical protein